MLKPSVLTIKPILKNQKLVSTLICLCVTLLLLLGLWGSGFVSYADTAMYDFLLRQKVRYEPEALNPRLIPVDLNDRSEMMLGGRLDDRSAFADLFSVMAYSGVHVSMDFNFQGERAKDGDMLEAAAKLKGLILGIVPVPAGRENVSYRELTDDEKILLRKYLWRPKEFGKGSIPRAGTFVMPYPELGKQAAQLAHISVEPDSDGIYRKTPLFYAWEDGFIPAISLATALRELGVSGNDIEIHYGKNVLIPLGPGESISIPIDTSGNVVVPFAGKWEQTVNRFSMDVLANARYDENELADVRNDIMGSLCFVADTTFSKKDVGPIPLESYYPLSGLHTWVISGILDASMGRASFYRESPVEYRIICIVLFTVFFLFLGMARKDGFFNIFSAALFFGFTALVLCLWFFGRVIPWYAFGAMEILFAWILGFIYRFLSQRRRQFALERYVPRSVAQKLAAGQSNMLIPANKDLTIVFTDISGFTKWSSDREPQLVHDFLNAYLESMVDIFFDYGATVDKFMGDGILAFFGDRQDMDGHAEAAIKCAIAMQKRIAELRDEWQPKAGIDLKVRIGINTGKVIVGDLGSRRRIEYTVIGSMVNLAQRMESLAPEGGILVTEYTRSAIDSRAVPGGASLPFSYGEKRELGVKGYDKPVAAYNIVF